MVNLGHAAAFQGPAHPTSQAAVAHRPLGGRGARLAGGLLENWQVRNRDASLPLAVRQLRTMGNLDNLRLAAAGAGGGYRGPAFMDSDIYKTLEAIGWEQARTGYGGITEFVDEATSLLEKAQLPDGYLNSYVQVSGQQRYATLESSHELYCAAHLIQAGIAQARGASATRLLVVAMRFADHLVGQFLGQQDGLDGHPIIETALVELYRQTGSEQYLRLARQFVEQRGHGLIGDSGFGRRYLQDHLTARQMVSVAGHAVRALYLESGIVDVAVETGDTELLASSITRWDDMVATKTAVTGGNGSRHSGEAFGDAYELPPDRAYNETCAAIASFQWCWRLLLATGESKYADLMERVLYNGFAAAISADGLRFFYVNPLQRRDDHFERDDPGRRHEWYDCACCPPNIMRLVASLEHYLATTAGDALYLHHFTGARIDTELPAGRFGVDMTTGYPWHGDVGLRVRQAPPAPCGLGVRIPGWSSGASIRVNGQRLEAPDSGGYVVVQRRWQPGDSVTVALDVRPRLTFPHQGIDALRGAAAVERGPLVYCFEQADQAAGVSVDELALCPGEQAGRARTRGAPLVERSGPLSGPERTIVVEAAAVHVPRAASHGLPYTTEPAAEAERVPVPARAIPYFQWDNRDGRAMRVWMPVLTPDPTAPSGTASEGTASEGTASEGTGA
jgi:DUF1680 family protein